MSAPWRPLGESRGGPRKGGAEAGSAPATPTSAFPPRVRCATSVALAVMPPGSWWLVLWLPPLATLPAGAVPQEEAAMSGNPGSGRVASLRGRRVTRGRGQVPPLSVGIRMLQNLICSGSHRWTPAQLATWLQIVCETLLYPSPEIS